MTPSPPVPAHPPGEAPDTVAIVADVHGNLQALDAVARDLAELRPDLVIANGDHVNRGPDGVAVLERLAGLGWRSTLGNHDHLVRLWASRDPSLPRAWYEASVWRGTAWCAQRLEEAGLLPGIDALPFAFAVGGDGAGRLVVAHGSPRHYREGIGPALSGDAVLEIARDHPFDVLVGSHTHRPYERRAGGRLLLNSGAVGAPFNGDPRAQYLVLRRAEDRWEPEFRCVAYDRAAALGAYERSGYLEAGGLSALVFLVEAATARSFLVPFLNWSEARGVDADEAAWAAFRREHAARFVAPDEAGTRALTRVAPPALG